MTDIQPDEPPRAKGIYLLPNLFTLTALFSGFYAIIAAIKGHFDHAGIAIFVAMVMDALDGRVARLTHTQTPFGAELDSLSDMVSFGIAPALIVYIWGLGALGKPGWLVAFIFAAAGALRLARFNIQPPDADKRFFKGLPIPAGASVVVSMVWIFNEFSWEGYWMQLLVALITIITGLLMVSNVRYYSFKELHLKNNVPFIAILLAALILVLISVDPPLVWFVLSLVFLVSGPIFSLWFYRKHGSLLQRLRKKP